MITPPLLLAAGLLLWGIQTDHWILGLLMGAGVEAARITRVRWELDREDYHQIWNLCVVLFAGAAIYAFTSNDGEGAVAGLFKARSFTDRSASLNQAARALYTFVQWMPIAYYPMLLAQVYGSRERIELNVISWFVRKREAAEKARGLDHLPKSTFNVCRPYLLLCVISAGMVVTEGPTHFIGTSLIVVWVVWPLRSRRFATAVWLMAAMLAVGGGWLLQAGMKDLERVLENMHTSWVTSWAQRRSSASESATRIGEIGRLKLSGEIALRLEGLESRHIPMLLRESAYSYFRAPIWYGARTNMQPLSPESNETTWVLVKNAQARDSVRIHSYLDAKKNVLALPYRTAVIEDLPVLSVETNRFGAVQAIEGPGLISYLARFGASAGADAPPVSEDLRVPPEEQRVLEQVAERLKLKQARPAEVLRVLARYFETEFKYTTYLTEAPVHPDWKNTGLGSFLLDVKAGHCEYFATATTLLLRVAGVPSRYAVGYSVNERRGKGMYVARGRDAHAWSQAWVDGRWQEVDNTPASWVESEATRHTRWESVQDFLSDLWFQFSKFRWGKTTYRQYLIWTLLPLLLLLLTRIFFKNKWRRTGEAGSFQIGARQGLDSEFFEVERELKKRGGMRGRAEPVPEWIDRLENELKMDCSQIRRAARLHYQYRFDPDGLDSEERAELRSEARKCLEVIHTGLTR